MSAGRGRLAAHLLLALRVFTAATIVAIGWLFLVVPAVGFLRGSRPRPELPAEPRQDPESRLERHGDIWHCHLAGLARDRGYACGVLTAPMMARHEGELFATLQDLVPWFPFRHLLLGVVNLGNRDLETHLWPDELQAIAGIARGYQAAGDPNAAVGPAFGRILGYHALHDVSQYLVDNPLVVAPQVGCSAVVVAGRRTVDGHVLVGRLFDFEGGRSFDFDKIVYTVAPAAEGELPRFCYLHVAWGGIHGAVTGCNEAGLWLSVNAAASDHIAFRGRPLVVAVARALETCRTIDEAVAQLTAAPVFVSESIVIATGRPAPGQPAAVCLELAPGHHHVRDARDDLLTVTNHFAHADWQQDQANRLRQQDGTTCARLARLQELVERPEPHSVASLAEVLRDRRGVGGVDLGFGHRSAINGWIGAHLVVADVTAGVLWVAEPEHGLGRMLAFDVHGPRPDLAAVPAAADAALFASTGRTWSERLSAARRLVQRRAPEAAIRCQELIDCNPGHYEPYALLALVTSERERAIELLRRAFACQPAYGAERREIEARLAALIGGR
ncbi:MAG: hypothetical protein IPK26_04020 [Planctomycetes bacterium]|nr:hypothetical protein [Planctomycetota bacterium]